MRSYLLACLVIGVPGAQAQEWGCYDPQPGHPTLEEKAAFIQRIAPLAQAAEARHGVPAAAIAAMAAVESGFGFTRTALYAKNLFGWKYTAAAAAGGRGAWTLECQPPEDVNNRYIQFSDEADAVGFVASRLAESSYYRSDTAAYQQARRSGQDAVSAARAWLAGIADPYNWRPAQYVRDVTRVMNDPLGPSDTINPERHLYRLSEQSGSDRGRPDAQDSSGHLETIRAIVAAAPLGRYMESNCVPVAVPEWPNLPTLHCRYTVRGTTQPAEVVLLNPNSDRLARWIHSACRASRTNDYDHCGRTLLRHIRSQSGAQFPVAGMVLEDMDGDGRPNQYAFRDGVTVQVSGVQPGKAGGPSAEENEAALRGAPLRAYRFARIAGTTREQYARYAGVRVEDLAELKWLPTVRAAYQKAWESDDNDLINAWAVANRETLRRR